jgi:hypothetical protein
MKIITYDLFKSVLACSMAAVISTGTALASDPHAGDTALNQALLADTESRQHMAGLRRADPELRKAEAKAKAAQANAIRKQISAPNFRE